MEQIIITHPDGSKTQLISKENISVVTKAEQTVSLLADDIVNISVQSATPLQFVLGDTVEVYGKTYTLNQLPTVKKTGERRFTYDLVFEGVQYELLDAQFLLPDNTVGDSFTGTLFAFVQILVSNANRVFPGKWTVGDYPDETEYKTLTFTGENCLSVLQRICEEWGQEFEIVQANGTRVLHIRNAGVNFPYTFKYGRIGGLYDLTRQNINSKNVVTRLFVYGGSNNLTNSYLTNRNSSKLCLPGKNKNTSYIQNAEAIANFGLKENTKNFDNIFPNRYGEVTAAGSKYYAFVDNTMDFDLNESDAQGNTLWIIAGVSAKVHFNTGNLAGYEFDVHKYDHSTKTIELVPFIDENGMKFPSETSAAFQFAPGDKYFFIDINLPDAYITEAESKLSEAGEEYYAQNSQPQVQYGLTIDEIFIKQFSGQMTVVNLFAVGDYIPVQDTDMCVDKSIRITGFTRDLLKSYRYSITLGNSVNKSAYIRQIADQKTIDQIIEINNLADPSKARRNWRASQEVLSMVFDPEGDYYSDKIKPASVETTMLQVGAKSMQFVLQNVIFEPNYQSNPNYIRVTGGNLLHYTIEDAIRNWTIAATEFSKLTSSTAYYIYARCQSSGNVGSIILDTTQRKVDYETGYYNFMVGVLNSVQTGDGRANPARIVSLTYGSTTINGRFIKTGRIESSGGSPTYFDLDNGEIGGNIKFLAPNNQLMSVADLLSSLLDTQDYIDNNLQNTLNELQNQIDGAIQYFFGTGAPTMSNYPVNTWNAGDYLSHVGDVYTDTDTGLEYRFTKEGNNYLWVNVPSTGIGQALQIANDALNLAGSKNTIFVTANQSTTPKAPYKEGDLWFILSTLKFKVCKTTNNNAGTYNASHWADAGYTDDTTANNALQKLTDMANDSLITPQEKVALKDEWIQIQSDYVTIASQANVLGIGYPEFTTAYTALSTYLNTTTDMFSNMSANTTINHTAFNSVFTNYYTERTKLVTQLSQAQIDNLNIGGQNYIKNSGYFQNLNGWEYQTQNGGTLTLYTANTTHGSLLRITKTGQGWVTFGTKMESKGGNICLPQGKFINGITYTIAFYVYCSSNTDFQLSVREQNNTNIVNGNDYVFTAKPQWQRIKFTFTANNLSSSDSMLWIGNNNANTFSYAYFTKFVLCEGNKAPEWKTSEYDLQYAIQANKDLLTAINNNFTQIVGGLILSTFLKLGAKNQSGEWIESAGLKAMYSAITEIAAYFGSTYEQALAGKAPLAIYHDGKIVASNAEVTGKIQATEGTIGGFTIASGRIGKEASGGATSGTGLSLYDSFIKFADAYRWAMIGTNVLPSSTGLIGVGRFSNETPNSYGTNYGLLISIKNALNNIAISATGDIVCNGMITDYSFTTITPAINTINIPGELTTPTMFKILAKFTNSNSGIGFPTRGSIASKLNISTSTPFAVKMIIITSSESTQTGYVRGRNTDTSGMETTQYAQLIDNNGSIRTDKINIEKGDIYECMLVWDNSNYRSYLLNYRP
jgi:hypothetical protein